VSVLLINFEPRDIMLLAAMQRFSPDIIFEASVLIMRKGLECYVIDVPQYTVYKIV
jgi:hypothetical protein